MPFKMCQNIVAEELAAAVNFSFRVLLIGFRENYNIICILSVNKLRVMNFAIAFAVSPKFSSFPLGNISHARLITRLMRTPRKFLFPLKEPSCTFGLYQTEFDIIM